MGRDLRGRTSEVRYAQWNEAHLAYRVLDGVGGGGHDVVLLTSGTMPMDALFDDPIGLRLLEGLADLGRLVIFDRCGIGMSDPPADADRLTYARWCRDVEAVVEAAQLRRPVVVANTMSTMVALLYADGHPEDMMSLALLEPAIFQLDRSWVMERIRGDVDPIAMGCPSRADEPGFREWCIRAGQVGASPQRATRAYPETTDAELLEIEEAASRVRVPTLVLRRPAHRFSPPPENDPITALVPGSVRVDLPGEDLWIFGGEVDALLAEIARFVTGSHQLLPPERILAAVLYSDLVASTDRATALGDAHWKRVLDRHDEIARSCVGRRGGSVIKTMGDGILAVLPSASNAFRASRELRAALLNEHLDVRVAVHVGDIDRRDDDISGLAVVVAARILELADAAEILASNIAVGATTGEPFHFESQGDHRLKGVPGTWQIYRLADA